MKAHIRQQGMQPLLLVLQPLLVLQLLLVLQPLLVLQLLLVLQPLLVLQLVVSVGFAVGPCTVRKEPNASATLAAR
jgi:hypothetical protein